MGKKEDHGFTKCILREYGLREEQLRWYGNLVRSSSDLGHTCI